MRVEQRAISSVEAKQLKSRLFPTSSIASTSSDLAQSLKFKDKDVKSNLEQRLAVQNIVAGTSKSAPYLIFGPPGTGKTKTTVEAIKQVLVKDSHNRVLACAPSNSAADLICKNVLNHVDKGNVFRMNAQRRNILEMDLVVKEVSCYNRQTRSFQFPSVESLSEYKVIVITLVTAGRLVSANLPSGFFSHIFIDEAGYATEPETLIPIAGLLSDSSQLVLAGDPKQLGPILRSAIATTFGLQISLLERLMTKSDLYKRRERAPYYDRRVVTKLVNNYRSHPDIISVPNDLFYDSELQYRANELLRNSLSRWEHLTKKGFPVVFDDIIGKDKRERDSPSFYNPREIERVVFWVDKLLNDTKTERVRPEDVGVISPYRKQVQKLRIALYKKLTTAIANHIKVGTVEEFQGQERLVIIISTVRSDEKYLEDDAFFKLGFVKSPKRFNVAITRAKALLIVVGNPHLLKFDSSWNKFMKFIFDKGGFTGTSDYIPSVEPVPSDEESDDESKTGCKLSAWKSQDEGSEFSKQVDLGWDTNKR